MPAPLSPKQKRILIMAGRKAYDYVRPGEDMSFDEWRHQDCAATVGKNGLRCCDQDDYKKLLAHYMQLRGEDGRALNHLLDDATNPKRVWMSKLMRQLNKGDLKRGYAEFICQRAHGCNLEEAHWEQVRMVFFTVRNRVLAKQRAGKPKRTQKKIEEPIWLN